MYSLCSGLFGFSVFMGAKSNFVCERNVHVWTFYHLILFGNSVAIWVCLLWVVTGISLFELIWTLEQYNRDLMWKQFISTVVNLCLFTLYLNIDEHTLHFPGFHKQYLQSCDRELSLLVFVPPRWGNGKRWSDFPDSPLRFNDRTKTRTSSWAPGSLSFPPPLASSNTDSSVNIPPESV